MHWKNYLTK